jgi:hypothetical protein
MYLMAIIAKQKEPRLSEEMQSIINRSHRDGEGECYDDNERFKYKIMKMLTENQDILWALHNAELESKFAFKDSDGNIRLNGDTYRDVSIFNFLKIPDIQSKVKNYICFEVNDIEPPRYNDALIIKHIVFRTVSHDDDYRTDWGIARQDLLSLIIQSEFDWTNVFGLHIEKIYDKGKVAENGYYYREFVYETTVANNLVNKAKNGGVTYNGRKLQ